MKFNQWKKNKKLTVSMDIESHIQQHELKVIQKMRVSAEPAGARLFVYIISLAKHIHMRRVELPSAIKPSKRFGKSGFPEDSFAKDLILFKNNHFIYFDF